MDDLNISKEYYDKVMEHKNKEELEHLIPAFVMVTLFMSAGLPGNLFVIIVYYRKMRRTTSRYFIIVLAALDLINCAFTMPAEMALLSNFYTFDLPWLCKLSRFITYSTHNSSAIILFGIAVDRFRKICQATKRSFTMKHIKIFLTGSIIFATICSIPSTVLYGTNTITLPVFLKELNITIYGKTCLVADKYWGSTLVSAFNAYLFCCMSIIFVVISIVYIIIGKEIFIRKDFRSFRKRAYFPDSKSSNIYHSENDIFSTSYNSEAKLDEASSVSQWSLRKHVLIKLETSTRNIVNSAIPNAKGEGKLMTSTMASSCSEQRPSGTCFDGEPSSQTKNIDVIPSISELAMYDKSQSQSKALDCNGKSNSLVTTNKKSQQSNPNIPLKTLSLRNTSKGTNFDSQKTKAEGRDNRISVRKTTCMLFLVTLFYIISFLPFMVIATIRNIKPDIYDRMSFVESSIYNLFLRSYFLNNVINPILYGFLNKQFRKRSIQLFRDVFDCLRGW
ncbi:hypothetical protein ACJMK2_004445 [Sinanodonta woodiana]|uniref:G-protein coupled receptors family 1 profile domain-containing protein n=1 Tax=Sinanodonta woodiana TaxID=1069815 RepID=A0ABD3Y162_SINWO